MKRFFSLLLSAALITTLCYAERVSEQDAAQVARNFLTVRQIKQSKRGMTPRQTAIKRVQAQQNANYYVYEQENGNGWVMIAANDVATPIIAYSNTGRFKTDNQPDNIKNWLLSYDQQITLAEQNGIQATDEVKAEWAALRSSPRRAQTAVVVNPLIKTTWNQSEPYSDLCPHKYPTGCVATAMAQIMYYHQWPKTGTGSHKNYYDNTLQANFGTTTYDWKNMQLHYSDYFDINGNYVYVSESFTTAQTKAVATLMYHCGVAVDMKYEENGSGAIDIDFNGYLYEEEKRMSAERALKQFFGYKSSVTGYCRNGIDFPPYSMKTWTDNEWIAMLKEELDNKRPILYSGSGSSQNSEGHSFICDGYDSNNKFHFNFGWAGFCDGFYSINNIVPEMVGIGGGNGDYSYEQSVVVGIIPDKPEEPETTTIDTVIIANYTEAMYYPIFSSSTLFNWTINLCHSKTQTTDNFDFIASIDFYASKELSLAGTYSSTVNIVNQYSYLSFINGKDTTTILPKSIEMTIAYSNKYTYQGKDYYQYIIEALFIDEDDNKYKITANTYMYAYEYIYITDDWKVITLSGDINEGQEENKIVNITDFNTMTAIYYDYATDIKLWETTILNSQTDYPSLIVVVSTDNKTSLNGTYNTCYIAYVRSKTDTLSLVASGITYTYLNNSSNPGYYNYKVKGSWTDEDAHITYVLDVVVETRLLDYETYTSGGDDIVIMPTGDMPKYSLADALQENSGTAVAVTEEVIVTAASINGTVRYVYVTDTEGNNIMLYDATGKYITSDMEIHNGTRLKKITGIYNIFKDQHEIIIAASPNITQGSAVAPELITTPTYQNDAERYIRIEDVEVTEKDGKYYICNGTVQLFTTRFGFGKNIKVGRYEYMDGIFSRFNSQDELLPTAEPTLKKYAISWVINDDIITTNWSWGTTPTFIGTPAKEEDNLYTYTFCCWDKDIVPVTADEVYTAVFDAHPKQATGLDITVDNNIIRSNGIIYLYSATGRLLHTAVGEMNTNGLDNGIYLISNGTYTKKLIIR